MRHSPKEGVGVREYGGNRTLEAFRKFNCVFLDKASRGPQDDFQDGASHSAVLPMGPVPTPCHPEVRFFPSHSS
ncbi:protein of unknown function [Methylocaldum szegediense]|uniref:Uncharacterized protein n=1 Tax=Methylocaldum szegediense TaxID=73780 RepID=A0ABN8X3V6_9GAMM|nr:protein of unknown function [Methylocaldum szegediense]